jgi:ribosomal protein S18 acetylase RimI-like enzyme
MIVIKELLPTQLDQVVEVDVTESDDVVYYIEHGELVAHRERWQRPARTKQDWQVQIQRWQGYLASGGAVLGAFDGEVLVGFAILRDELSPGQAELAGLFVSRTYRRKGIAARLTVELIRLVRARGAREIYVSATPSRSAVGFYQSQGFMLAQELNPVLFELEPEDIHMVKHLI